MSVKRALVVDDSKSARFALRKHLEAYAYTVDAAENADEAYACLSRQRPDVIFLDHIMPGTDGFDVLRKIKSDPATVSIPVVICSSGEGAEFNRQARARGATDVLQKPPSPEQIARVLENVYVLSAAPRPQIPPAGAPAAKVQPIRQPEVAIEQAVMRAVRNSLPSGPRVEEPPAAYVASSRPVPPPAEDKLRALREQIETRLRKLTQDFYAQLGDIKAQIANLDSAEDSAERTRQIARQEMEELRSGVEEQLMHVRRTLDELARAATDRHEELLKAARDAAAEEAQRVAEQVLMNATARISDQLAESVLKTLEISKSA